jgi:hypothetical protein
LNSAYSFKTHQNKEYSSIQSKRYQHNISDDKAKSIGFKCFIILEHIQSQPQHLSGNIPAATVLNVFMADSTQNKLSSLHLISGKIIRKEMLATDYSSNDAVSISHYTALNGGMINRKGSETIVIIYFKILSRYSPELPRKPTETTQS